MDHRGVSDNDSECPDNYRAIHKAWIKKKEPGMQPRVTREHHGSGASVMVCTSLASGDTYCPQDRSTHPSRILITRPALFASSVLCVTTMTVMPCTCRSSKSR
jgi:hypothetical protein